MGSSVNPHCTCNNLDIIKFDIKVEYNILKIAVIIKSCISRCLNGFEKTSIFDMEKICVVANKIDFVMKLKNTLFHNNILERKITQMQKARVCLVSCNGNPNGHTAKAVQIK